MADSYKLLSEFYKQEHPEFKDEDDRLVAEFAVSENPNDFKTEDFDWEEGPGLFARAAEKVKTAFAPEAEPREIETGIAEMPAEVPGAGFAPELGPRVVEAPPEPEPTLETEVAEVAPPSEIVAGLKKVREFNKPSEVIGRTIASKAPELVNMFPFNFIPKVISSMSESWQSLAKTASPTKALQAGKEAYIAQGEAQDEAARQIAETIKGQPENEFEADIQFLANRIADAAIISFFTVRAGPMVYNTLKATPKYGKALISQTKNLAARAKNSLKVMDELDLTPAELTRVMDIRKSRNTAEAVAGLNKREKAFWDALLVDAKEIQGEAYRTGKIQTGEMVYPWKKGKKFKPVPGESKASDIVKRLTEKATKVSDEVTPTPTAGPAKVPAKVPVPGEPPLPTPGIIPTAVPTKPPTPTAPPTEPPVGPEVPTVTPPTELQRAPEEIINPVAAIDAELATETHPRARELLEDSKVEIVDDLFNEPGAMAFTTKAGEKAVRKLEEAKIPYAVIRMDIEGMNTANAYYKSHGKANVAMRKILGQGVIKDIIDAGGIVSKGKKADEIRAVLPYKLKAEAEELLINAQNKGIDARDAEGIGGLTHMKYNIENYGALDFTYSVLDGKPGKYGDVDREADALEGVQKAIKLDMARKIPTLRGKELNDVIRKLAGEAGIAAKYRPEEGAGEAVEGKPVPERAPTVEPIPPAKAAATERDLDLVRRFRAGEVTPEEFTEQLGKPAKAKKPAAPAKEKPPKVKRPPKPEGVGPKAGRPWVWSKSEAKWVEAAKRKGVTPEKKVVAQTTREMLTEGRFAEEKPTDTMPASELPKEFTVGGEKFTSTKSTISKGPRAGQVVIRVKDGIKEEFAPGDVVYIDSPEAKLIPEKIEKRAFEELGLEEAKIKTQPKAMASAKKEVKLKVRKRGISSVTGSIGGKKQAKLKETQDEKAVKTQNMFDWQRSQVIKSQKIKLQQAVDLFMTRVVQHEYPIAKHLIKSPTGREALMHFQLSRGASAAAKQKYTEIEKKIYETIPYDVEEMANDVQQAFRTIEVEELKRNKATDKLMERIATRGLKKESLNTEDLVVLYDGLGDPKDLIMTPEKTKRLSENIDKVIDRMKERVLEQAELKPSDIKFFDKEALIKSPKNLGTEDMNAYLEGVKKQYPDLWPSIKKSIDEYRKVGSNLVDGMFKEGLIDEKYRDYLKTMHKYYSPRVFLHHVDPQVQGVTGGGKVISVAQSGIESLDKGSEEALINDRRFLLQQMVLRVESRIFKNKANKALLEYVKENPENELGIVIQEPKATKTGQVSFDEVPTNTVRVFAMIDGKKNAMLMPADVAQHWVNVDPQISQQLAKVFRFVSGTPILKAVATGVNPEFAVANFFRDMAFTWFKQHDAYSPILPVAWAQMSKDMIKVLPDILKRKGRVKDYIEQGGGMDFLTSQGFLFKKKIGEVQGPTTETLAQINEALGYIGNTSELLVRIALRERLIKKGYSPIEATWLARTNLDFAQGGSISKSADNLVPYLNAGTQGTRGVFQSFKANPKLASAKVAQLVGLAGLIAYTFIDKEKDAWQAISDREKVYGWIIPLPISFIDPQTHERRYAYIRIPKDQAQRIFAAIGETGVEAAMGLPTDGSKISMALTDFIPVGVSSLLPPTLSALLTYTSNKDFWKNRDIWKGRKVDPKYEYYPDTPKFWVATGDATGLSPTRLETATSKIIPHTIYSDLALESWDQARKMMYGPDAEKANKAMYQKISELPFARKLIRLTYPYRKGDWELRKECNTYMIDTFDSKGKPLPKGMLIRMVNDAKKLENNARHVNDIELNELVKRQAIAYKTKDRVIRERLKQEIDGSVEKYYERAMKRTDNTRRTAEYKRLKARHNALWKKYQ